MATKTKPEPKTFNNTSLTEDQIIQLKLIGRTVNNWRGRNINLLEHPSDPDRVISVGITFDGLMTVICDDERQAWATALDYIAHGKVYVRD